MRSKQSSSIESAKGKRNILSNGRDGLIVIISGSQKRILQERQTFSAITTLPKRSRYGSVAKAEPQGKTHGAQEFCVCSEYTNFHPQPKGRGQELVTKERNANKFAKAKNYSTGAVAPRMLGACIPLS
jgi:hypothetical protein